MNNSFRNSNDRGSLYLPNDKDAKSLPLYKLKSRILSIKSNIDSMEAADDMMVENGTSVHREQILLGRKAINIRKVYLEDNPLGGSLRYKVGWVVDKDMKCCMICLKKFNWFRYKHHCRSCGYLICYYCSPYNATIAVFVAEEPTGSKVCKNCFGLKNQAATDKLNPFDPNPNSHPDSPHTSSTVFGNYNSPYSNKSTDSAPKGIVVRRRANSNTNTKTGTQSSSGSDILSQSPLSAAHHIGMYNQVVSNLDNQHQAQYKNSYLTMRGLIPPDIIKYSVCDLIKLGLSEALATRIWSYRVLWFIIMNPSDIKEIHIADLRGKYTFQELDLTEMRAIWFVLPAWPVEEDHRQGDNFSSNSLGDSLSKLCERTSPDSKYEGDYFEGNHFSKADWRAKFKMKLDDMAYREAKGTLPPNEIRHEAYEGFENRSIFDASKVINSRITATNTKALDLNESEISDLVGTPVVMKLHLNKSNIYFGDLSEHSESCLNLSNETISESSKFHSNENDLNQSDNNNNNVPIIHTASYLEKLRARNKLKSISNYVENSFNSKDPTTNNISNSMSPLGSDICNFVEHEVSPDSGPRTFIPFSDKPSPVAKPKIKSISPTQLSPNQQQHHKLQTLFPISREHLIYLLESGNISAIESLLLLYFNSNDIDSSSASSIIEQMNMCEELGMLIDANTASKILLKAVSNPLKLQQPLLTLMVLVEVLHADVNVISDKFSDVYDVDENVGKSPIYFLITHNYLGSYLMSKGADALQMDPSGECAFYESVRQGIEWMVDEFEENGSEIRLLKDESAGSCDRKRRYVKYLFFGGYATKVRNLLSKNLIKISAQDATSIMTFCQRNYENMHQPAETFELLHLLGSQKVNYNR